MIRIRFATEIRTAYERCHTFYFEDAPISCGGLFDMLIMPKLKAGGEVWNILIDSDGNDMDYVLETETLSDTWFTEQWEHLVGQGLVSPE